VAGSASDHRDKDCDSRGDAEEGEKFELNMKRFPDPARDKKKSYCSREYFPFQAEEPANYLRCQNDGTYAEKTYCGADVRNRDYAYPDE
jgi:hypothetical protein